MTIKELKEKIKSYPYDEMPFCIDDVFSWRGAYYEPACSLSTRYTKKEDNLLKLERLLTETFYGWKGGEFTYSECSSINFEDGRGHWSDGQYITDFILDNIDNDCVKYIFHS